MSYKYIKNYRTVVKRLLVESLGGECCCCGYSACLRALDFHHVFPSSKEFTIASYDVACWEKYVTEVRKCVLVCKNCHAEIEDGVRDIPENAARFNEAYADALHERHKYKRVKYDNCPVCGAKKLKRRRACSVSCAGKLRQRISIHPDVLRELVWKMPTTQLAQRLGVSDSAVGKLCKKLGIPKPPRGYWQKKVGG